MSEIIIINCQFTAMENSFFQRAEMCLSKPELELFAHCKKTRRQQQFLAGHYLLRVGLSHLLGHTESFWDIGQKIGTAPILLNPLDNQQVYLSISHSKDQVICAVSINNPVGIDIENHQRERPFVEFSEQYLSDQELAKLKSLKGVKRKSYFYELWTVMESVAKAQGQGLDQDIFSGTWQPNCHAIERSEPEGLILNKRIYSTYTTRLGGFTLSIATRQPLTESLSISQLNLDTLCDFDIEFSRGRFLLDPV